MRPRPRTVQDVKGPAERSPDLWRVALLEQECLPEGLQYAMLSAALRDSNVAVLAGLASRADLAPSVAAALDAHPAARVQMARLSQANVSPDLLDAAVTDSRVSVRAAASRRSDLRDDHVATLLHYGGAAVLLSLIGNVSVSVEWRLAALNSAEHARLQVEPVLVRHLILEDPAGATGVLARSSSLVVAALAAEHALPDEEALSRLADLLGAHLDHFAAVPPRGVGAWSLQTSLAVNGLYFLTASQEDLSQRFAKRLLDLARSRHRHPHAGELRALSALLRVERDVPLSDLACALREADSATTAQTLDEFARHKVLPSLVVPSAGANEHISPTQFRSLVVRTRRAALHALNPRFVATLDPEKAIVLAQEGGWFLSLDRMLDRHPDPQGLLAAALESSDDRLIAEALGSKHLTALPPGQLPSRLLSHAPGAVVASALEFAQAALGDRPQSWEALWSLLPTHEGSWSDLVAAARLL